MDVGIGLLVFWGVVGWCGTPPKPWPWPWPPGPWPPDPWPLWVKVVGIVGGIVGGFVFTQVWGGEATTTLIDVAASGVGAWVGSVFFSDMTGMFLAGKGRAG